MSDVDDRSHAEDRVEGLAVLDETERAADEDRAKALVAVIHGHKFERRAAARALAGKGMHDERRDAQIGRLRDIVSDPSWSPEATATANAVTIVVAESKSLDEALARFEKWAASEHAPAGLKPALARSWLREVWNG